MSPLIYSKPHSWQDVFPIQFPLDEWIILLEKMSCCDPACLMPAECLAQPWPQRLRREGRGRASETWVGSTQSGGLWAPGSGVEAGMGAAAAPSPLRRLPIFITVNKICLKGHCVTFSHLFRYNQSLPLLSSYRARVDFITLL